MKELRKLLIAKGFKLAADDTLTKLETRCGPDASTSSMAKYINECRNAQGFHDYKIAPIPEGFLIATDYCYGDKIEKLDDYANALIKADVTSHFANIRIAPGSLSVTVISGQLAYKYVPYGYDALLGDSADSKWITFRPELENRIIEYAMEVLPAMIQPEAER